VTLSCITAHSGALAPSGRAFRRLFENQVMMVV